MNFRVCCLAMLAGQIALAADPPLSHYYGFLPPEIYKLDQRTSNCLVVDINGDGLNDIVIVNNLKNQIDVLQQQKGGGDTTPAVGVEANDLPNPTRLLARKIPLRRTIASLVVRDLNGDKRPDLIYIGTDPNGLYVQYQEADGSFGEPKSFEIEDASTGSWSVDVADMNGDGRPDIAFLGKENLYVCYQGVDGRLDEPKKFRLSSGNASLLRALDLDGDGRADLVYMTEDPQFPVRMRFQNKQGRLGPERQFEIERARGVSYAKIDASKPGINMMTISDLTSRLMVYGLAESKAKEGKPTSQIVVYPFDKTGSAPNNDLAVGDFDGDGRTDVAVTDAGGARITLYRQTESDGLDLGTPYPAPLGTSVLRTIDLANDKKPALLTLSTNEKTVGLAKFADGKLGFPASLPTKDEPVAIEVLGSGADTRVVYIARVEDSANFSEKFFLRALKPTLAADGKVTWASLKLGGKDEIDVQLAGRPTNLMAVDANADGKLDLLLFPSSADEAPALWLGGDGNAFVAASKTAQGALGPVSPAAVFFGKLTGDAPSLLVAQNNFARRMKYDQERWSVAEQFNAPTGAAKVSGVQAIDLDNSGKPKLAIYDRTAQAVVFLAPKDNVWSRNGQIKVGAFGLKGMRVGDFNGDGKEDLLLFDGEKFGLLYNGKTDLALETVASYESDERRGKLFDMTAGDLNHDGRIDILAMDSVQHNLEVIAVKPKLKLERAVRWQVFEEKTFRNSSGRNIEPREIVIGDVNGDGREDVVVLVHDRVVVYLQDAGLELPKATDGGIAKSTAKPADSVAPPPRRDAGMKPAANNVTLADNGKFFKPETLIEARQLIAGIKTNYKRDVAVETFASMSAGDREKYDALSVPQRTKFLSDWAQSRQKSLDIHGVYIFICKQPGRLEVRTSDNSLTKDEVGAVQQRLLSALKERDYDTGLLDAIKLARQSFANKSR